MASFAVHAPLSSSKCRVIFVDAAQMPVRLEGRLNDGSPVSKWGSVFIFYVISLLTSLLACRLIARLSLSQRRVRQCMFVNRSKSKYRVSVRTAGVTSIGFRCPWRCNILVPCQSGFCSPRHTNLLCACVIFICTEHKRILKNDSDKIMFRCRRIKYKRNNVDVSI